MAARPGLEPVHDLEVVAGHLHRRRCRSVQELRQQRQPHVVLDDDRHRRARLEAALAVDRQLRPGELEAAVGHHDRRGSEGSLVGVVGRLRRRVDPAGFPCGTRHGVSSALDAEDGEQHVDQRHHQQEQECSTQVDGLCVRCGGLGRRASGQPASATSVCPLGRASIAPKRPRTRTRCSRVASQQREATDERIQNLRLVWRDRPRSANMHGPVERRSVQHLLLSRARRAQLSPQVARPGNALPIATRRSAAVLRGRVR